MESGVPLNQRTDRSYAVAAFSDPEAEVARLRVQAGMLADLEEAAFQKLGFPERGRVIDVGAGPGFVAARLKAKRPALEIVALDVDAELLGRAPPQIQTVVGSAERLPFVSSSFDCAYARLLLRHVPRPDAVLAEMERVLAPDGKVIIADSDDGALVLEPMPDGLPHVLAARQETSRRSGGNPFIARALPALLRSAGFETISLCPLVVDSITLGARTFAEVVLSPITQGIAEDLLPQAEVQRARDALGAWAGSELSFGMTTALVVGGTKPPRIAGLLDDFS